MEATAKIGMPDRSKQNISATFKDYGKRLWKFVRNKVSTNEDAEDILQDVWYQFSSLSSIDELENISGWLYKTARNRVTDSYRKKRTDSLEDYLYEGEEGEINFREILLMNDDDPALGLFKELFWEALVNALEELPENQKQVFILNELEDVTLQEIADKTGENLKTIISRKGYAVKHLRRRLAYLYNEINL
jgi:RNA polymerase sigma factor (sigma-70 family)